MADGSVEAIPINTWTQVATATTICNVLRKKHGFDYYYATVDTGGSAPTAPTAGIVPAVAVPLFPCNERDIIVTNEDADVYINCIPNDSNIGTGDGSVRVDS